MQQFSIIFKILKKIMNSNFVKKFIKTSKNIHALQKKFKTRPIMKLQFTKIHKSLFFFRPTVLHDHAASRLVKRVNMSMTRFCPVRIHCFVPGEMFRKCYLRVHVLNSAKLHTSRKLHKNWLQHFKMQWLAGCARRIISYF